ncbi:MAG: heterodisulfide reductase-related iron-sulfur binding cluster, partial [Desulfobacterales bacterium]|nr:heterodisulfide reductase-related iron-sulfur binding cluster [Desulfobacterales bacterium]
NDIGPGKIKDLVKKPFTDLKIAPYYGCQCLRPYAVFDDPEKPKSMEPLIEAIGAKVYPWEMGGKCCGASHINTEMEVGMELVHAILHSARGADAIVTVCPMCQMNLEAYQQKISKKYQEALSITILYLPQLLGLAIGLSEKDLRLDLNLAITKDFRKKLKEM